MTKRKKDIYWIVTLWLALGMTATGIVQLLKTEKETANFLRLGYPSYLLIILGVWKILGVMVVLLPGFVQLKEWAYAGFFFAMSGAIVSHLARADSSIELFGPTLLLVLTMLSWYCRPADRKLVTLINTPYHEPRG